MNMIMMVEVHMVCCVDVYVSLNTTPHARLHSIYELKLVDNVIEWNTAAVHRVWAQQCETDVYF